MILVGDIGGTNTRLAWFAQHARGLAARGRRDFRNDDFASLYEVLATFLGNHDKIAAACFGVAGLVIDGRCQLTNRGGWLIEQARLAAQLGAPALLINDMAAIAAGVPHLPESGFVSLQQGTRRWGAGTIAVVGVGTGLGQGAAFWDGARHRPFPSEAGHADFAPADRVEFDLAAFLDARHGGHASIERVVSGPGLADIADFLVASGRHAKSPSLMALPPADRPAEIVRLAVEAGDALALASLEIFINALARETGNAALRFLALGGIVLAGGIPPRLLPLLQRPRFLEILTDKGRFSGLLRSLPVRVAIDAEIALLGAAHTAAAMLD